MLLTKCHKDGCDQMATLAVRLHLICRAWNEAKPVSMNCTIKVCERHRDDVRPYLLSDVNRETMITTLTEAGLPEPDFLTARIEFLPISAAISAPPLQINTENCCRVDCTNPAKYQIGQRFRLEWQAGEGKHLFQMLTNLFVCEKHKRETKPADLLDDDSRKVTRANLAKSGIMLPDFKTMELEFFPIDGRKLNTVEWIGGTQPYDFNTQGKM